MDKLERGRKIAWEIGLSLFRFVRIETNDGWDKGYREDDIHRLLGESVEMFAQLPERDGELWSKHLAKYDTHKALLIAIRPLVQESEERKLLRELANYHFMPPQWNFQGLIDRAKALLAKDAK